MAMKVCPSEDAVSVTLEVLSMYHVNMMYQICLLSLPFS
uniref:Uncharacterized protein n=1 Tax=Arundo donax TaxID=35708 RepID=A0A0A9C5V0_ARUDO